MADDQIRYDLLVKDALRSVIKKVLTDVAKNGLPDSHHFFITFLTEAAGVKISSRLKQLYPQQMTIVLQHQFWGLKVTETAFEVSLSFSNIPETLVVPFNAVQIFLDPIAAFETTFDLPADASNNNQKTIDDSTFFSSTHVAQLLKNTESKAKAESPQVNIITQKNKSSPKKESLSLEEAVIKGKKLVEKTSATNINKKPKKTNIGKADAKVVVLENFRNNKE